MPVDLPGLRMAFRLRQGGGFDRIEMCQEHRQPRRGEDERQPYSQRARSTYIIGVRRQRVDNLQRDWVHDMNTGFLLLSTLAPV